MRAHRLISLLLLLQSRGRLSARELALTLEVSERTIYRDVLALSGAGVPVYAETGRHGGYALLDSYRTNLTGLAAGEVRALFLALLSQAAPQPLADLGLASELQSALLKISAALPPRFREDESRLRQRILLDSTPWDLDPGVPNLPAVQQAVLGDRALWIRYSLFGGVIIEQEVEPYALVAKAGVWYLVYARLGHIHTRRLSALLEAHPLERTFTRMSDFDLNAHWQAYTSARQRRPVRFSVLARISPGFKDQLPYHFGPRIRQELALAHPPDAEGWVTLTLPFEYFEDARSRLLGFGRAVEVLEPPELRLALQDYAAQIAGLYAQETDS